MRATWDQRLFGSFNVLVLGTWSFAAVYPLWHVVCLSLSTHAGAANGSLLLYPHQPSVAAYKMVLANEEVIVGALNSISRTVTGTALTMFATCLTAYPLSVRGTPLRKTVNVLIAITLVFSGGTVPNYLLVRSLGLLNNRLVYVLPGLISAFNLFLVKTFFERIPPSYSEAARIDGASDWHILWKIYVPMSRPGLLAVALWTAVAHWNAWLDALLYVPDDNKHVLQFVLQRVVLESNTQLIEAGVVNADLSVLPPEAVKAAMIVVTIAPMLLLYLLVRRQISRGIAAGGINQ